MQTQDPTRSRSLARRDRASVRLSIIVPALAAVLAGCASGSSASPGAPTQSSAAGPSVTIGSTARPSATTPLAATVAPTENLAPTPQILAAATLEPALKLLWEAAGPRVGTAWTWEPAIDPAGRVWAASSFDDVFWIIDRDGKDLESWGTSGSGDGELHLADQGNGFGAVAFRSDGGFYVADTANYRVEEFDLNRAFVRAWGSFGTEDGQFTDPIDIATDAADNVYVFSDGRLDVQEFGPDGTFKRVVATNVGPYIAVAGDGTLYAIQEDPTPSIQVYAPDGRWTRTIDLRNLVQFATGIAVTDDGRLFVASSTNGGAVPVYEHLLELAPDGHLLHLWPGGGEGIAVTPSGDRLYVAYSNVKPAVEAYVPPAN